MLRDHDVARLAIEFTNELAEVGRRVERRSRVVRLRARKKHTVRAGIDVHQDDECTSLPERTGQLGAAGNDIGRRVGRQVAGRDTALKIDQHERGGRYVDVI